MSRVVPRELVLDNIDPTISDFEIIVRRSLLGQDVDMSRDRFLVEIGRRDCNLCV